MNMQRRNRKLGDMAELMAERYLINAGYQCVEKQATPIKICRVISRRGIMIRADIIYEKKVSSDFKCIKHGKYTHVEVKRTDEPKLSLTVFSAHQMEAMKNVVDAGGVALVLWVHASQIKVISPDGMPKKGKPLRWSDAGVDI